MCKALNRRFWRDCSSSHRRSSTKASSDASLTISQKAEQLYFVGIFWMCYSDWVGPGKKRLKRPGVNGTLSVSLFPCDYSETEGHILAPETQDGLENIVSASGKVSFFGKYWLRVVMTMSLPLHSQWYRHSHLDLLGEMLHFVRPRGFTEHSHCLNQFFSLLLISLTTGILQTAVNWGLI